MSSGRLNSMNERAEESKSMMMRSIYLRVNISEQERAYNSLMACLFSMENKKMVRAWCLTRKNGRILGLGPNSLPQVFRTRELARQASARLREEGIATSVVASNELSSTAWAVARDGKVIGNGVTSVPMVFRTREQARSAVRFAEEIGYTDASVVRFGQD